MHLMLEQYPSSQSIWPWFGAPLYTIRITVEACHYVGRRCLRSQRHAHSICCLACCQFGVHSEFHLAPIRYFSHLLLCCTTVFWGWQALLSSTSQQSHRQKPSYSTAPYLSVSPSHPSWQALRRISGSSLSQDCCHERQLCSGRNPLAHCIEAGGRGLDSRTWRTEAYLFQSLSVVCAA